MTSTRLHIDRLRIRVRGASPEAARAAVDGLGPELLHRLLPYLRAGAVAVRPVSDHLDLGVRRATGSDALSLRSAVAGALAGELTAGAPASYEGGRR